MARLAVVAGALLVAVACAGGGSHHNTPATSRIRRPTVVLRRQLYYFSIGERGCRKQLRHQHGADALVLVRTEPSRYASIIEAGCHAALPTIPHPSRYFRLGRRICARAGTQAMEVISQRYVTLAPNHQAALLQGCWTEMNSAGNG